MRRFILAAVLSMFVFVPLSAAFAAGGNSVVSNIVTVTPSYGPPGTPYVVNFCGADPNSSLTLQTYQKADDESHFDITTVTAMSDSSGCINQPAVAGPVGTYWIDIFRGKHASGPRLATGIFGSI